MKGSIYKRGKFYAVSFSNGFDEKGKRKRYTKSGFTTKKQAEKYLFELNQKYYNGELALNDNMLLSDYMEYWFENYVKINLAENTIAGYKTNIYKHINPEIGHLIVGNIKPVHIQEFYKKLLEKGLSATTINYIHRNLHAAFIYAMNMQMFFNPVFERVKPPKQQKYKSVVLTSEQAAKLIKAAKDTEIYLPIVLGISLGLRRGETLGLQWSDLDIQKKTLKIERAANRTKEGMAFAALKTESSRRTLLLSNDIISIIMSEKSRQEEFKEIFGENYNPNDLICCRSDGNFITTNYLDKHFKSLLITKELPVVRFHDLRHSNATLQIENNVPIKVVSSRLGHSSTNITMDIYAHYTHQMQEMSADVISKVLFGS